MTAPITKIEDALVGLQGCIAAARRGDDQLKLVYPVVRDKLMSARRALEQIGLFTSVSRAIDESESLARAGRFGEAEDLILEVSKTLMSRSGTEEQLRRQYRT